jgi:hypothetical protein
MQLAKQTGQFINLVYTMDKSGLRRESSDRLVLEYDNWRTLDRNIGALLRKPKSNERRIGQHVLSGLVNIIKILNPIKQRRSHPGVLND